MQNDYSWNVEQNELIESSEEDAAEEDQLDALIFYNNQYYQSKGVDITSSDGESFEVIASLTGKVTSVKEDDLLGKVVEMEHDGNELQCTQAFQKCMSVKVTS